MSESEVAPVHDARSLTMISKLEALLQKLKCSPNLNAVTSNSTEDGSLAILQQLASMRHDNLSLKDEDSTVCDSLTGKSLTKDSSSSISCNEESEETTKKVSEDTTEDFELPSEEMADKILEQVENYFTDFNIMKDSFLLKHIRRSKEGYISLKLVASFRRVKAFTKNWKVVQHCVRRSSKLQLNEDGTKIKRVSPVPAFEDTPFAKTVIVYKDIDLLSNLIWLNEKMSKYGEVSRISIITPDSDTQDTLTKRCRANYKDLVNEVFAFVEFKTYESAVMAWEYNSASSEDQMKIVPLLLNKSKVKSKFDSHRLSPSSTGSSDTARNDQKKQKKSTLSRKTNRNRVEQLKAMESSRSSPSSRSSSTSSTKSQRSMADQGKVKGPTGIPTRSNTVAEQGKFGKPSSHKTYKDDDYSDSYRTNKRSSTTVSQPATSANHHLPDNVIRMPRGPDGTNGFHPGWRTEETSPPEVLAGITKLIEGLIH